MKDGWNELMLLLSTLDKFLVEIMLGLDFGMNAVILMQLNFSIWSLCEYEFIYSYSI